MSGNALKASLYYGDILLGSQLDVKDFSLDKFVVFHNEPMPVATDLIVEITSDDSPVKGSAVVIKAIEGEKDNSPYMEIRWVEIADDNLKILNTIADKVTSPQVASQEEKITDKAEPSVSVPDVEDIDTTMKMESIQEPVDSLPSEELPQADLSLKPSDSNPLSEENVPTDEPANSDISGSDYNMPEQIPESDSSPEVEQTDANDSEKSGIDSVSPEETDSSEAVSEVIESDAGGEEKSEESQGSEDGSDDDKPRKKKVRRRTKKS